LKSSGLESPSTSPRPRTPSSRGLIATPRTRPHKSFPRGCMGAPSTNPTLGNLIINAFDRICTSTLLSFRAFRRSAGVSSIIWLFVFFVPSAKRFVADWGSLLISPESLDTKVIIAELIMGMLITVWSDYFSLLFVRKYLSLARIYPIRGSVISSIVGLLVVAMNFTLFLSVTEIIISLLNPPGTFVTRTVLIVPKIVPRLFTIMAPALIIHLWLPLFALSTLLARLVFWIFRAVYRKQLDLKTLVCTRGPNFLLSRLEARLVDPGPHQFDDFFPSHVANDELFDLQSQIVIKRYRCATKRLAVQRVN
jgi:hypothetical protein